LIKSTQIKIIFKYCCYLLS